MKTGIWGAALLITIVTTGCVTAYGPIGPTASIYTNVPFHASTVTIVNGTPHQLDVVCDGRPVARGLRPGQHFSLRIFGGEMTTSCAVIAAQRGRLVGTAERTFYVSGQYRRSETWTVRHWDIR